MPSARSAATAPRRRASRAAPRPRALTTRRPIHRVRWDRLGRVTLLVVFAAVIGLYAQHTLSYFATRAQAEQQQAIVRSLKRSNAALLREQNALNDPAVIQRDARALGMVYPGERPYVITGLPAR